MKAGGRDVWNLRPEPRANQVDIQVGGREGGQHF